MILEALTSEERDVVRLAIDASVNGPHFPDWEFQTLFGITRAEAASVLARFPHLDAGNQIDHLVVYNAIANLLGYPHGGWQDLEARGLNAESIRAVSRALRGNDDVSIQ